MGKTQQYKYMYWEQ